KASQSPADVRVLGPAEAPIFRLKGYFRFHLQLQSSSPGALHQVLRRGIHGVGAPADVGVTGGVGPRNILWEKECSTETQRAQRKIAKREKRRGRGGRGDKTEWRVGPKGAGRKDPARHPPTRLVLLSLLLSAFSAPSAFLPPSGRCALCVSVVQLLL